MILTQEQVAELTDRRRRDSQAKVLRHMGIEFRQRPDGSLAVSRAHVDAVLGVAAQGKVKEFELGAVR
jgi:hypothetical protein